MNYTRRPAECEAMLVTPEAAPAVAAWCGGVAMPDGVVMIPAAHLSWTPVLPGLYITRDGDRFTSLPASDFERLWAPTEGPSA